MSIPPPPARGWKTWAMAAVDRLLLRIPFVSEFLNQGVSKSLGLLAGFHLVSRVGLEGDYAEFGVFRGEAFRNAIRASHQAFRGSPGRRFRGRFLAFDSFQGLPAVPSMREAGNPYQPGEFAASRVEFERALGPLRRREAVEIIAGWFDATLNDETARRLRLEQLAFVNIDCDLYESTRLALEFVTPFLRTGTILYFDDWFSCRGAMDAGEPRAAREWLAAHSQLRLVDYRTVGITGKMFIVNVVSGEESASRQDKS